MAINKIKKQWLEGKRKVTPRCKSCGSFYGENHNCELIGKKISHSTKGKGHWNWKGGISTSYLYSREYWKARDFVLLRDNSACRRCGAFLNLDVHHIDENRENNEINNLVTLCKSCHAQVHRSGATW